MNDKHQLWQQYLLQQLLQGPTWHTQLWSSTREPLIEKGSALAHELWAADKDFFESWKKHPDFYPRQFFSSVKILSAFFTPTFLRKKPYVCRGIFANCENQLQFAQKYQYRIGISSMLCFMFRFYRKTEHKLDFRYSTTLVPLHVNTRAEET